MPFFYLLSYYWADYFELPHDDTRHWSAQSLSFSFSDFRSSDPEISSNIFSQVHIFRILVYCSAFVMEPINSKHCSMILDKSLLQHMCFQFPDMRHSSEVEVQPVDLKLYRLILDNSLLDCSIYFFRNPVMRPRIEVKG